jgi:hypothetical protein
MLDAKCFPPEITCVDHVVQRVVPHCRELLETLEAHVNVEWAHSVTIIRYLYKYLYKNETTAKIAVSDPATAQAEQLCFILELGLVLSF